MRSEQFAASIAGSGLYPVATRWLNHHSLYGQCKRLEIMQLIKVDKQASGCPLAIEMDLAK